MSTKHERKRNRDHYTQSAEERTKSTTAFLKGLKFSKSIKELRAHTGRDPCPECGKKRQYYCYDCLKVTSPATHPPPLHLPINVHVVLHAGEHRSKSTTLPASTISPNVKIMEYPTVPENLDPMTTLVFYPSATATDVSELHDAKDITDLVVIDSTWQQSKAIARDERVTKFRHVKIKQETSLFWRFQNNDPSYLATVEAIYYALKELVTRRKAIEGGKKGEDEEGPNPKYDGEVDDLLFYYVNQYITVQSSYTRNAVDKAAKQAEEEGKRENKGEEKEEEEPSIKKVHRTEKGDGVAAAAASSATGTEQQKGEKEEADSATAVAKMGGHTNRVFNTRHFNDYILNGVDWENVLP